MKDFLNKLLIFSRDNIKKITECSPKNKPITFGWHTEDTEPTLGGNTKAEKGGEEHTNYCYNKLIDNRIGAKSKG
jgi:hypothetical protein